MKLEPTIDKKIEKLRQRVLDDSRPSQITIAHLEQGRVSGMLSAAFLTDEITYETYDLLEEITLAWLFAFTRSVHVTDLKTGVDY